MVRHLVALTEITFRLQQEILPTRAHIEVGHAAAMVIREMRMVGWFVGRFLMNV